MKQVTISHEEFQKLMNLMPDIHALEQSLSAFANKEIIKRASKIKKTMTQVFTPFFEAEDDDFTANSNALSDIGDKNKISSIWSVSEVRASDMNKKVPSKVKSISYQSWGPDQKIEFKTAKNMTWLQMWIEADKLIKQSEDTHHVFVEEFIENKKNPGHFSLSTGS